MAEIVCRCWVAVVDGLVLVDLSAKEEEVSSAGVVVSYLLGFGPILSVVQDGVLNVEFMGTAVNECCGVAVQVSELMRTVIVKQAQMFRVRSLSRSGKVAGSIMIWLQ